MRMLDRTTNLNEQVQALMGGEVVLLAVVSDFDATDQLHHEIRPSGAGGTVIQDLGDIGMVHECQRLALSLEARNDRLGVHPELNDLERDPSAQGLGLLSH